MACEPVGPVSLQEEKGTSETCCPACEAQGQDGRPQAETRGLAETRPADGSVWASASGTAAPGCHVLSGNPGKQSQHSFLSMAVHPVWEQECHTRSPCSRSPVHSDRWGKVTVWAEPQTPHLVAAVGREGRVGTSITRLPW